MSKIIVIGSANIDLVVKVASLPKPGETVSGSNLMKTFGGKGANQAVAAARLGGSVELLARFGDDDFRKNYLEHLAGEKVKCINAEPASGIPTGCAIILVEDNGQNIIAVSPGANAHLLPEDIVLSESEIRNSSIVVLQAEIPIGTIEKAIGLANKHNIKVIFNPSPIHEGFEWDNYDIDYLIVNETEIERITGCNAQNVNSLVQAARKILKQNISNIIITCGAAPTIIIGDSGVVQVPTFPVRPVDTTGSGDAFTGAFAIAITENKNIRDSVRFANAAGALTATRPGAQISIPSRDELERFMFGSVSETNCWKAK